MLSQHPLGSGTPSACDLGNGPAWSDNASGKDLFQVIKARTVVWNSSENQLFFYLKTCSLHIPPSFVALNDRQKLYQAESLHFVILHLCYLCQATYQNYSKQPSSLCHLSWHLLSSYSIKSNFEAGVEQPVFGFIIGVWWNIPWQYALWFSPKVCYYEFHARNILDSKIKTEATRKTHCITGSYSTCNWNQIDFKATIL